MKSYCRPSSITAVILTLLFWATVLTAQSDNASVSGVIKDPSGAVVPGTNVVLKDERTALERRATTNQSGYYILTSVPPGNYSVSAEAAGFKKAVQMHNNILPSAAANIDIVLQLGGTAETVSVTASAGAVQEDSGTLGRVVERNQIQALQTNGRNPLFMAQLIPGVSGSPLNGFLFDHATWNLPMSVNGARPNDTMVFYDGAPAVRTRSGGFTIGTMDADSVQEVQVLTAGYSAEYGRATGGQIRMVTRGGGRLFHGTLYEFFGNSALNANSWSRNKNPDPAISSQPAPYRFNQFGYNLNGPIYIPGKWNRDRNKLFFFWAQEYVRYTQDQSSSISVPSRAMRQGDFSQLLVPNQFIAGGAAIKDPLTGQPFPGNIIPNQRLSPNGIGLLNAYPEPTQGYFQEGTNRYTVASGWQNMRKDTISIDYNPREAHQIRFRALNFIEDQLKPFQTASGRTPAQFRWPNQTASINYVWTIAPTIVNELLASVSRDRTNISVDWSTGLADRTKYGINYPYIFPGTKDYNDKIPTVTIQAFATLDGSKYPVHTSGPIYRLSDNLTKIHGNHTLKFGAVFERSGENDFDQVQSVANVPGGSNNQNGSFTFTNVRSGAPTSGVAIANAALGIFDTYAEIGPKAFTPLRTQWYEWFAQDGWKVSAKLRLELGIRNSLTQPYYSLWNNAIYFDPSLYSAAQRVVQDPKTGYILTGRDFNGMVIPGSCWPKAAKGRVPVADSGQYDYLFRGGYPKGFSQSHSDFQPRFGIAYQIGRGQVLRAGGGRFTQTPYVNDAVYPGGQAPFQPMVSMLLGSVDNPSAGSTNARFPTQAFTQDRINPDGEAYNWNVSYGITMPLRSKLEVSYVGRRGLHNLGVRNINQLQPGSTYANPGINPNYLRPYGGYYSILMADPNGSSKYNAFQMNWTRSFYNGLSFGVAYTYSAAYDDGSAQTSSLPNAYDRRAVWGPSAFDRPHILVINYIYDLPFLKANKSWIGKMAGGWSLSGTSQFQSGVRASVTSGDDFAGVGPGSANQFWVLNGDPTLPAGQRRLSESNTDANFWFQTKNVDGSPIFAKPAQGTYAAVYAVGIIRQPGIQNWNLGLVKNFRINERQLFRFQAQAFNWINHPNWGAANVNPTAAAFGRVSAKQSERSLQLSLRYSF